MADTKISALTSLASGDVDGDEIVPVVDTPLGTPATKGLSLTNMFTTMNIQGLNASYGNLTVAGSATLSGTARFSTAVDVSATLSVGAQLSVGGFIDAGMYKLGSASGANNTALSISGTWTNFHALSLIASGKGQTSSTNFIINLYSDGGTTPFLTYPLAANTTATASQGILIADIFGANADAAMKLILATQHFPSLTSQAAQTRTATANTDVINCVKVSIGAAGTTATISAGHFVLYGLLK